MRKRKKKWIVFIFTIIGITVIYACVSLWMSTNYIVVREYEVETGKCKNPVRAAVISDLHDREFGEGNAELIEKSGLGNS